MSMHPMDKILKKKLEDISVKYQEQYWSSMEDRLLEEGFLEPGQAQNDFFRDNMLEYVGPSQWESFSGRLSASEDANFDLQVQNKLSRFSVPYDDASWHVFYQKLQERDAKDRKIFFRLTRVAAVILLMLLSATSVWHMKSRKFYDSLAMEYKEGSGDVQDNSVVKSRPNQESTDISARSDIGVLPTDIEGVTTGTKDVYAPFEVDRVANIGLKNNRNGDSRLGRVISSDAENRSIQAIWSNSPELLENHSSTWVLSDDVDQTDRTLLGDDIPYLEGAEWAALDYGNTSLPAPINNVNNNGVKTSLGMFVISESDMVTSPNSPRDVGQVNTNGVGATMEFEKGNMGISIGAKYQNMEYLDYRTEENSDMDFVNIPIEVQYSTKPSEQMSLYAIAGIEGHFAMLSDYSVLSDVSRAQHTRHVDGLARNGGFNNNAFATANLGVGIEQRLGEDIDAFGEVRYKSAITQTNIGAGDDLRFGFSFTLGAKVTL